MNYFSIKFSFLRLLLCFSLVTSSLFLLAAPVEQNKVSSSHQISKQEFQLAISQALTKVEEFRFIKQEAEKLGVKAYLFGGTAASFAYYVKWDLLEKKGDRNYYPERFTYKYPDIYRLSQDMDIVIDGSTDAISILANKIAKHYPYLQGEKGSQSTWELRSLRENIGNKMALLKNFDFLNQHTDSNSVGLIEITNPSNNNQRIRDLKNWDNSENSNFINDVVQGKIHYYFSSAHPKTQFYIAGTNPPIISVIRYFIKVFQFNLEMLPEDLEILKKIISDFNPYSIKNNGHVSYWFKKNAPKLLQNSIDLNFAMKTLEDVGLRKKLAQIDDPSEMGSIAWWMSKEPLKSYPLGVANKNKKIGKTAEQLKIDIVAHGTNSYSSYESITNSPINLPNVFISRSGKSYETANYGNGFYTMKGTTTNHINSKYTIRFKVNPRAREYVDFVRIPQIDIILILNRMAITVIPETLTISLKEYYKMLLTPNIVFEGDVGVFKRYQLAMRTQFLNPQEEELSFLQSQSFNDLFWLCRRDSTIESKKLIFKAASLKLKTAQDILAFFTNLSSSRNFMFYSENDDKIVVSEFLSNDIIPIITKVALNLENQKDIFDFFSGLAIWSDSIFVKSENKVPLHQFLKEDFIVNKVLQKYLAYHPSIKEVTALSHFFYNSNSTKDFMIPEIQSELLNYILTEKLERTAEDTLEFLKSLIQFSNIPHEMQLRWQLQTRQLISNYKEQLFTKNKEKISNILSLEAVPIDDRLNAVSHNFNQKEMDWLRYAIYSPWQSPGFMNSFPTVLTYEIYLRTLLESSKNIEQFLIVFSDKINLRQDNFSNQELIKSQEIKNQFIAEFLYKLPYLKNLNSENTTSFYEFYNSIVSKISNPQTFVIFFDFFIKNNIYDSWRNPHFLAHKFSASIENTDLKKQVLDEFAIYQLLKTDSLSNLPILNQSGYYYDSFYKELILNFMEPHCLERLGLKENKELITLVYSSYLLNQFRIMLLKPTQEDDYLKTINIYKYIFDNPAAVELNAITKSLVKKYKDVITHNLRRTSIKADLLFKMGFLKTPEKLLSLIKMDQDEVSQKINTIVSENPILATRMSYLNKNKLSQFNKCELVL